MTTHRLPRFARRRAQQRGAAMVEAVVVIPFFLTMLACILYVGRMYETKLRVMRLTKQSAWSYAMCNCGTAGDGNSTICQPMTGDAPTAGAGASFGSETGGDTSAADKAGGTTTSKSVGSSQASMSSDITSDVYLGSYTKTMKSQTRVMCNEAPHDGSVKGFISAAFDSVTSW